MPMIDSLVTASKYVYNKLDTQKADVDVKDVWYGDQAKIPRTPAVCVEPSRKQRVLDGAPRQMLTTLDVIIIVYHCQVTDIQKVREKTDRVAEDVEALLHKDPYLTDDVAGRQAIHSFVSDMESGYANRSGTLFRTTRMTFEILSKVGLPLPQ